MRDNRMRELNLIERIAYKKAIDDFAQILKNQLTIDAIIKAKDNPTVCAIIKRQAENLKKEIEK